MKKQDLPNPPYIITIDFSDFTEDLEDGFEVEDLKDYYNDLSGEY